MAQHVTHARTERARHLFPHEKHWEGGAVSNAVAELAHAKLSNNYYCTCMHIHMMHAACRDVACDGQSVLASHLAGTVELTCTGY